MKSVRYLVLISLLAISGCTAETVDLIKQSIDTDTIWVFAQFNIPQKEQIEDYYYYGRINKGLYEQIINGDKESGFILLRDVRYWTDDDEIEKFEDETDTGDLAFRIDHLMRIELNKGDPLILKSPEEKAESTTSEEEPSQQEEPS